MMKGALITKIRTISAALAVMLLTGCADPGDVSRGGTETLIETETTAPDDRYLLVRGWYGYELLDSIFFCGKNRPLPMSLEENPDIAFSDGVLSLPDGSLAGAAADPDSGRITLLHFDRGTAPADLSVYGIGFDASPEDIPDKIGIANTVSGSEDTALVYSFYEGGVTELTFVFEKRELVSVHIES